MIHLPFEQLNSFDKIKNNSLYIYFVANILNSYKRNLENNILPLRKMFSFNGEFFYRTIVWLKRPTTLNHVFQIYEIEFLKYFSITLRTRIQNDKTLIWT